MKVVCLPARWPAVQGFDRRVPPSSRGYCGLIAGGWRCDRLRWLHPRFLDGEVRNRCAANSCEGHQGFPTMPTIPGGCGETI